MPFPEPSGVGAGTADAADIKELFLRYLDYYRSAIAAKLDGLSDADLRTSRLPSGWSPIELLNHLVHMERRWLRWRFQAERVDRPFDDQGDEPGGRWQVGPDESVADLLAALRDGGERTRAIVEDADLAERGRAGAGFGTDEDPPTLVRILFHVLQEYARHAGHLDVVRELADGVVGE